MGYFFAALAGGLLFFNSQASPKRVARGMEDALRRQMPNAQVQVSVEGRRGLDVLNGKFKSMRFQIDADGDNSTRIVPVVAPTAPNNAPGDAKTPSDAKTSSDAFAISAVSKAQKAGRIGQFSVVLRDFDIEGVRIESAELNWKDVVYDWGALRKKSRFDVVTAGAADVRAVVAASSLQSFIAQKTTEIQNPKLSLRNGRFIVSGTRAAPIFGTQLPFTLSARPEVRNGTEIWLADAQASFAGAPLPSSLVNDLAARFNPVYTLALGEKWPFSVRISRVSAQNDKLEVLAALTFIPAPAAKTAPVPTKSLTPIPTPPSVVTPTATPILAPQIS